MQQSPHLAAPTALAAAIRTTAIRSVIAPFMRPTHGIPMDGSDGGAAAGGDGGAGASTATIAVPATGGGEQQVGQAPSSSTTGAAGQQQPGTAGSPLFDTPPAQQPAGEQAPGARQGEQPGQPGYQQSTARPAAERSLDEFPPEIRDYIGSLRKEAGDHRVKAKTAEQQAEEKQRQWLEGIAKVFGLIEDTDGDDGQQVDPAVQAQQLTEQLARASDEHLESRRELAIWKVASKLAANPQRLTDSRTFMTRVSGLDPAADDFGTKLAAAVTAQLEADPYYKADPGPAPAVVPPPVPSGGDFAGGPSGGASTDPQTVEDFRETLRKRRERT